MTEVFMEDAQLRICGLTNVRLARATLTRLELGGFLRQVDFSESRLGSSYWRICWASDVRLSAADLTNCTLRDCHFKGATFDRAGLNRTAFVDVRFEDCKGLDAVAHLGPSTFSLSTIQGNKDVPGAFWKSAGLDGRVIETLGKSGDPGAYRSCFLSYANQDNIFVQDLFDFLVSQEVPCFKAPASLDIGASVRDAIYQAIADRNWLLVILSRYSVSSDWLNMKWNEPWQRSAKVKRDVFFLFASITQL